MTSPRKKEPNQGFTMHAITPAIVDTLNTKARDLYNAEKIKEVIRKHQNSWPAQLRDRSLGERAAYHARGFKRAARRGVVWPPCIIQEGL